MVVFTSEMLMMEKLWLRRLQLLSGDFVGALII